ncbi:uncharacterized protein LOC141849756 [Brevipalpus obovatus]|uniref:uncharacterized protein LOC141849756 n=1 Tax=Brevipalpus obovatus TaxID=246614 RepID=UPI003D9DFFEC
MGSESDKNVSSLLMDEGRRSTTRKFLKERINSKNLYFFSNIFIWLMVIVMFFLLVNLMSESHANLIKYHEKNSVKNDNSTIEKEWRLKLESKLMMAQKRLDFLADKLFSRNSTFPFLEDFREIMEHKVDSISHELIPIGFIYIQLPHQSTPALLWPWAKWEEVTSTYSGHFFRAEGAGSAPFGAAQEDAIRQHQHSSIEYSSSSSANSVHHLSGRSGSYGVFEYLTQGKTGNISSLDERLVSDTETRPKNYAVKIWTRVF